MRCPLVFLLLFLASTVSLAGAGARPEHGGAADPSLAGDPDVAARLALFADWVEATMAATGQPGIAMAVVHRGDTVWQRGFGVRDLAHREPMTIDTVFRLGSVSKVFTTVAVLQLRDAGQLRLEDPVMRHLPWFRVQPSAEDDPPITVRHLLTHTSGLPREAPLPYWTDRRFPDRATLADVLPSVRTLFPPDADYQYSNLGMGLLGHVVEAAAGRPWQAVLEERVFAPLGLERTAARWASVDHGALATGYLVERSDGALPVAPATDAAGLASAADVSSSARELARFVSALLPGTPSTLLSEAARRDMRRAHWLAPSWTSARGLGVSIWRHGDRTLVGHGGWVAGYRSQIAFDPSSGFGALVLTNADQEGPGRYLDQLFDFVIPALEEKLASAAPAAGPFDLSPYPGRYQNPWGERSDVHLLDGALVFFEPGHPARADIAAGVTTLHPVAVHTFRIGEGPRARRVVFELDETGRVRRVRVGENYLYPVGCGTVGEDLQCRP